MTTLIIEDNSCFTLSVSGQIDRCRGKGNEDKGVAETEKLAQELRPYRGSLRAPPQRQIGGDNTRRCVSFELPAYLIKAD